MCGIVGVARFGESKAEDEKMLREVAIFGGLELLKDTRARGEDATGLAILFDNSIFNILKMGVSSPEFLANYGNEVKNIDGFIKVCRENTANPRILLGHCRKATVGGAWDNVNNHPIRVGNIVGVHNGTLKNHDIIFSNIGCKRDGEVDSEAVFRLVQNLTEDGKHPFTVDMMKETLRRIDGAAAALTFNTNNPYQLATMRYDRPLETMLIRPYRMLFFASEKKILESMLYKLNMTAHLYRTREGFKKLVKEDIAFEELSNDTVSVFDLLKEVDKDTKIKDLYSEGRVIWGDHIWKEPIKTKVYGVNPPYADTHKSTASTVASSVYNTPAKNATDDYTSKDDKDTKDAKKQTKASALLVWDDSIRDYIRKNGERKGNKDPEKTSNVVINLSDKTIRDGITGSSLVDDGGNKDDLPPVIPQSTIDQDKEVLTYTVLESKLVVHNPGDVDKASKGAELDAEFEEIIINQDELILLDDEELKTEKNSLNIEGVDIDKEVLKMAESFADGIRLYKNHQDIADDLNLSTDEFDSIEKTDMANVIRNLAARRGFYYGFINGRSIKKDNPSETTTHVRQMKTLLKILLLLLSNKSTPKAIEIANVVEKKVEEGADINPDALDKIISDGDYKQFSVLREIRHILATIGK